MAIDFPNSPTNGQVFISGAQSWTWDGTKWVASGLAGGPFVPQAGYVPAMNDNRIINGDMHVNQRSGVSTTTGYTVDRWFLNVVTTGKGTWFQNSANLPVVGITGCGYTLSFASSGAYVTPAAEIYNWQQPIEADMIADFGWGTPSAQPVTLSFWAQASQPGTYSGSIKNTPVSTRSYPFTFNIAAVNTWQKFVITIPGDTAGTWALQGNGIGAMLCFDLGSGANYRSPANVWANGNYFGVPGAISVIATNAASIYLTGVKLEVGSVATPFNRQSLTKSLADCQRYYQQVGYVMMGGGNYTAGALVYGTFLLPVALRATPTFTILGTPSYLNCSALGAASLGLPQLTCQATVAAAGAQTFVSFGYTLSAEL
jgi:hypothetical protein